MTSDEPRKAPTIKDVAALAGVSFKTVSRVLNQHPSVNPRIRLAVEEAIRTLDYRPHQAARALRSARSYSVALLTGWGPEFPARSGAAPDWRPLISEFLSELTMGCGVAVRDYGYHLICDFLSPADQNETERNVDDLLRNLKPDGVLLAPPLCDSSEILDLLERHRIRYARLLPGTQLDRGLSFAIDDLGASRSITNLLLEAGHRHLGMIAGLRHHIAASERQKGFESAIAAVPDARCVIAQGDFTTESGRLAALELLRQTPRPTAIFAANDAMAAGVFAAAAEMELSIPGELSLIGFDDALIASMANPPLTTVRQPTFEMAMQATRMLIEAANSRAEIEHRHIRLDYSISQRKSVGPPPALT